MDYTHTFEFQLNMHKIQGEVMWDEGEANIKFTNSPSMSLKEMKWIGDFLDRILMLCCEQELQILEVKKK